MKEEVSVSSVVNETVERSNGCVSILVKHLQLLLGLYTKLICHFHCPLGTKDSRIALLLLLLLVVVSDVIHHLIQHPNSSAVQSETLKLIVSGTTQETSTDGRALPHGSEFLLLSKGNRKGASFEVNVLPCSHAGGADGAGNLGDETEDGGSGNKVGRGERDNVLEAEREEGITSQNGHVSAEDSVVRWLSSADRIIVHTGEVIVNQRSRVDLIRIIPLQQQQKSNFVFFFQPRGAKKRVSKLQRERERNHFKGTCGGESGESIATEELAGGHAHYRRGTLGAFSED